MNKSVRRRRKHKTQNNKNNFSCYIHSQCAGTYGCPESTISFMCILSNRMKNAHKCLLLQQSKVLHLIQFVEDSLFNE